METEASDTSSEASYFEQEPISGAVLLDQELLHREKCEVKGTILTGCSGLDDYVLLGGLTPGRVVGLSAEDETFGLLLGLQTLARLLVMNGESNTSQERSATIITTLSHAQLLPTLRSVIQGQVDALPDVDDVKSRMMAALERISISRVFDFDGLQEALDELDTPIPTGQPEAQVELPTHKPNDAEPRPSSRYRKEREIQDSEDDDEPSSIDSPADSPEPSPPAQPQASEPHLPQVQRPYPSQHYPSPDIVLITNMTALLTSLYTTRDRKHAHRMLRHLSSRLRYLSRSPLHGGPLFILVNSTSSKSYPHDNHPTGGTEARHDQPQDLNRAQLSSPPSTPLSQSSSASMSPPHSPSDQQHPRHLPNPGPSTTTTIPAAPGRAPRQGQRKEESHHSAIYSIFNPPPPNPGEEQGRVDDYGYARHPNPDFALLARLSRRNKPFFGQRFGAVVDVHLLATRAPRTDADAEVYYFSGLREDGGTGEVMGEGVGLVWVVEVLRDEVGVWIEDPEEGEGEEERELGMDEGGAKGPRERLGRRFDREQRWAGVEVREEGRGVRVVDVTGFSQPAPGR